VRHLLRSGRAHNPKVVGSNPTPATMKNRGLRDQIPEPFGFSVGTEWAPDISRSQTQ
jgi:hypothetical protein